MLRVALDVTALLGPRTGIGTFVAELTTGLAARDDVEVVGYATTWRGRHQLHTVVPPEVAVAGRPMAARPLRMLWKRVDALPIERWTDRVDVVHGPNYVVPPTRRAAAVASVHDLTFLRFPAMSTRDTLEYPSLLRRAIRRGAWLHVDAASVAEEVVDAFGVDRDRVVVVPLAPSPVPAADPAGGRALAGAERYVLALGTVEPRKDLPGLVAAFDAVAADHPDVRLVIAGPDGWGTEALTAAIATATHRSRIVRLGWVDGAQRAGLLRGATALAYPSVYEGFGLPPLEAMSVGTPVVTTDAGALAETCADGALVVPTGDVDALAAGLARVLDDGEVVAELRTRGRAVASRYGWDRTVDGLVELYRRTQR